VGDDDDDDIDDNSSVQECNKILLELLLLSVGLIGSVV